MKDQNATDFEYSQLVQQTPAPLPDDYGFNLWGNQCLALDPLLLDGDPHIDDPNSTCVDNADPLFTPVSTVDIDDQVRTIGGALDRGADEFLGINFIRGDADGDCP